MHLSPQSTQLHYRPIASSKTKRGNSQMLLKCHNPPLQSGERKDWKEESLVSERTEKHLWVCVWDWNVSVLIWKNRDLLFVLEETGEKEVGGGTLLWMPAKTNSKLLWGLKWVPINHTLRFWELFHFQFLHISEAYTQRDSHRITVRSNKRLTLLTHWHSLIVSAVHSPRRGWRKNTSW